MTRGHLAAVGGGVAGFGREPSLSGSWPLDLIIPILGKVSFCGALPAVLGAQFVNPGPPEGGFASQSHPVALLKPACGPSLGGDWFSSLALPERSDGPGFVSRVTCDQKLVF